MTSTPEPFQSMTERKNTPPDVLEQVSAYVRGVETYQQIVQRLGLDPADVQTPARVSHVMNQQRAAALAEAEEKRWTDLEARVQRLEAAQRMAPPTFRSTGRIPAP